MENYNTILTKKQEKSGKEDKQEYLTDEKVLPSKQSNKTTS